MSDIGCWSGSGPNVEYVMYNQYSMTESVTDFWKSASTLQLQMTEIWVNIGSGNGLLPDGIKPLPGLTVWILNTHIP